MDNDDSSADLVQPEGVNAGSAEVANTHREGDVRSGGDVETGDGAPDPREASPDAAQGHVPVDPAALQERKPSEPHGSSGQDAGLME
jgi:hypothetical protein